MHNGYIIYNSYGEKEKYGISSIANIEIDLSTLSSGIYYIQCILNVKFHNVVDVNQLFVFANL